MSLQDLGAIGEFVSSIFMLVTLIYLATQVRYLKRQAEMQATYNRAEGGRELLLGIANSDYLPGIMKAMRDHVGVEAGPMATLLSEKYGIDSEAAARLSFYFFAWLKSQEAHFGNISSLEQESSNRLIQSFSMQVGFDEWWSFSKVSFNDDFSAHVERLIRNRAQHEVETD